MIHGFSDLIPDLEINYNLVKDNFLTSKYHPSDKYDKDKEDYRVATEIFEKFAYLTADKLDMKGCIRFTKDIQEATKVFRYIIKALSNNNENRLRILSLEILWKSMLILLDTASSNQSRIIEKELNECAQSSNMDLISLREEIRHLKLKIENINTKYKEAHTRYIFEVTSVRDQLESATSILEAKNAQVEQLLNPHRFIYVHYFLKRFHYKFSKNKTEELLSLSKILEALNMKENYQNEINDSIGDTYYQENYKLPPSLMQVLRKLEELLDVDAGQISIQLKSVKEELKQLDRGVEEELVLQDECINTDPLKELNYKIKLMNREQWRSVVLNSEIKNIASISPFAVISMFEDYISQKLIQELQCNSLYYLDSGNSQIDFGTFMFGEYVIKYGQKTSASSTLLSLYNVNFA